MERMAATLARVGVPVNVGAVGRALRAGGV
jgi:hypothetical protein